MDKAKLKSENDLYDHKKPDLIKKQNNDNQAARVSLQDCLACSGCITTAETLLIEAHSIKEFLNHINSGK